MPELPDASPTQLLMRDSTYSIVERHGGIIEITPGAGGGTLATIRLPIGGDAPAR